MEEVNVANGVDSVIDLAAALSKSRTIDGEDHSKPYIVVPEGYEVRCLEHTHRYPLRPTGTVTLADEASFIDYVRLHRSVDTMIYMAAPKGLTAPRYVAVLNDNAPGALDGEGRGDWRDFRAIFAPELAPEWVRWTGANGQKMAQADFALFIEDNLPDIIDPPAAQMLEIARSIEAKKKASFASSIRLSDGSYQLTHEEEIQGTAAKGQLTIPDTFDIGVPVLLNGSRYKVTARLRFRIPDGGGKLVMWFDLLRPHTIINDVVTDSRARIAAQTERPIFVGTPD